ncbi:MAG: DUF5803 family protein [Halobacteria archaeon]
MRRHLVILLIFAAVSAGCLSSPDLESSYEDKWGIDEDAEFYVGSDNFTAVVKPNSSRNETELEAWRRTGLGKDEPVELHNLKARFANGTVSNLSTETRNGRTVVNLSGFDGEVAYMVTMDSSKFRHHVPVSGSVKVVLPRDKRVSNPLLGRVYPPGYNVSREGRINVTWNGIERNEVVEVDFYSKKDPYILGGLVAVLLAAAVVVILYYRRVIEKVTEKKEKVEE